MLKLVVSGGQTGVDRAALDAARRLGLSIGGWCPKGRKAEDGPIPAEYPLNETPDDDYRVRTDWNIRDSQGTLILTRGAPTGGTATTLELAESKHHRPCLVVDLDEIKGTTRVCLWVADNKIATLNVAGPRESTSPGIYKLARAYLIKVFLDERASGITLQNCVLKKRCNKRWQDLQVVPELSTVRFCAQCQEQVFFCQSDEELAGNIRLGHCVAFDRESPGTERGPRRRTQYLGDFGGGLHQSDPLNWDE